MPAAAGGPSPGPPAKAVAGPAGTVDGAMGGAMGGAGAREEEGAAPGPPAGPPEVRLKIAPPDERERLKVLAATRTTKVLWLIMHGGPLAWAVRGDSELVVETARRHWWYAAAFGLLFAASCALFVATSTSDPGYVRRGGAVELRPGGAEEAGAAGAEAGAAAGAEAGGPEGAEEEGEGRRWCGQCGLWQPLRAKHCRVCDRCVRRYDHHCIWLGSCVGERNHGLFWWYLLVDSAVGVWGFRLLLTALRAPEGGAEAAKATTVNNGAIYLFLFLCFLFLSLLLPLLVFHTYLVATNQTTWEVTCRSKITYFARVPAGRNPFHRGCVGNVAEMCAPGARDYAVPADLKTSLAGEPRPPPAWWSNRHYDCC